MAGPIQYKLPGFRPRRHERNRGKTHGEWNPPELYGDIDVPPPKTEVGFAESHRDVFFAAASVVAMSLAVLWGVVATEPSAQWLEYRGETSNIPIAASGVGVAVLFATGWVSRAWLRYQNLDRLAGDPNEDLLQEADGQSSPA